MLRSAPVRLHWGGTPAQVSRSSFMKKDTASMLRPATITRRPGLSQHRYFRLRWGFASESSVINRIRLRNPRSICGKMRLPRLAILALVLLEGARAQAATQPPPSSELLLNSGSANDAFAAVGRFQGSLTCTAILIDPSGSGASGAGAWL